LCKFLRSGSINSITLKRDGILTGFGVRGSVYTLTARTFLIWRRLDGKPAATVMEERQDQEEMQKRLSQLNPFSSEV